ncbi:MAG: OmpA family protein [Candidatus Coatesbacteria bacterium]|nr:OmpA family protein [Candidatus Coatesbacteria bacterium]
MSGSAKDIPEDSPPGSGESPEERELARLREIINGPERKELENLKKRLDDPRVRAREIASNLPEAFALHTDSGGRLTKALMPSVEEALQISVNRNRKSLAAVIFPLMGPAIRKAISSAIREMIQSLNKALEHGLSIRGLRWRIEAIRTGKSFAEVVLFHTLAYRVEQLFLIHKETGLLLQHVSAGSVMVMDSDLVSGMLTAIQDFVRDSFSSKEGDTLQTMQVGDLTVWIEDGPEAVLAAVIRGEAPEELKSRLTETLESVHSMFASELSSMDGDTSQFDRTRPILEECLIEAAAENKKKRTLSLPFILVVLVILSGAVYWSALRIGEGKRWDECIARLNGESGIVITSVTKDRGKHIVRGLRDPLAADPAAILAESGIPVDQVEATWLPYQSLAPDFILKRARRLLLPPTGVYLSLEESVLHVSGSTHHKWILRAREIAMMVQGVDSYDDSGLRDLDLPRLEHAVEAIQNYVVRFQLGSTQYADGQQDVIDGLKRDVKQLYSLAALFGKSVDIRIVGHTDSTGTEAVNAELSLDRAKAISQELQSVGPRISMRFKGVGSSEPVRAEATDEDRILNRSVTFEVELIEMSSPE